MSPNTRGMIAVLGAVGSFAAGYVVATEMAVPKTLRQLEQQLLDGCKLTHPLEQVEGENRVVHVYFAVCDRK